MFLQENGINSERCFIRKNAGENVERYQVVRGTRSSLDLFLAKQRYKIANKLIRSSNKNGRILDIGCGCYPFFLAGLDFSERYGLDKMVQDDISDEVKKEGINLIKGEIEKEKKIPFEDDYFDVVTMLAVFEHLEPENLVDIHKEIYRVLKPNGVYVMTTPAFWTESLLRFLAKIKLISDVEIKEHKGSYSHSKIASVLRGAFFSERKMKFGYFEFLMNNWATAFK